MVMVALMRLVVIVPVGLAVVLVMMMAAVLTVVVAVVVLMVMMAPVLTVVVAVMLVAGIRRVRGGGSLGVTCRLKMSSGGSHGRVPLGGSNPGKNDRGQRERQQRHRCGDSQETAKSQCSFAPTHPFTPSSPLCPVAEYTCSYRAASPKTVFPGLLSKAAMNV
jgi:hypothetical protein